MTLWRFRQYVTEGNQRPFVEWLRGLPVELQARFWQVMAQLAAEEDWSRLAEYKLLSGHDVPLSEIRYLVVRRERRRNVKVRVRPLGYRRDDQGDFVLLGGVTKRHGGQLIEPTDGLEKAKQRLNELLRQKGSVDDL